MVRITLLMRRKRDLSERQFMDYYENNHAPLAVRLMPGLVLYRRNFVTPGPAPFGHPKSDLDLDVITEMVFRSQEDYENALKVWQEPGFGQALAEDHAKLFDVDAPIHAFFTTEAVSEIRV